MTDGWRKWPDEKPEKSGVYLVYFGGESNHICCNMDFVHYNAEDTRIPGWAYYVSSITHWRELPAPPVSISVTMSPDASPETVEALGVVAELAVKAMEDGKL